MTATTTTERAPGTAWVLRSPCGCPHGATLIAYTVGEAWEALAGDLATASAKAGWTLTAEPTVAAVADVRARLGACTHPEGKTP